MQERPNVPLLVLFLLLGGALTVYLGIQAKSVWVGVLIFVGVFGLLYGIGTARMGQGGGFSLGVSIGVIALSAAVYMSQLAGRFWWTPLFIFLSLLFIGNGLSLLSENIQTKGGLSVVLSIVFFLFAILGPWLLYGHIPGGQAAPAPAAAAAAPVARGEFFPGMWQFMLTAGKSGWGILYYAIVILLGRIWFGKWGWLIAPVLLILASGVLAWYKPGGAEPLIGFFTTAPLALITTALTKSANQFGSAAWGAILCGIGLVILLAPAYIVMYSANRAMVQAQKVRQDYGTTIAANLLRGQYNAYTSLVSLVTVAASVTGFILIWKALSGLSGTAGPLEFQLLGVADVSLPRWKPIWQWPYFLNAGVYALISLIGTMIQRRLGLALFSVNWFLVLLGSFLLSLFVPAGVINFLTGQTLMLCLVAPVSLLKKTKVPEPPRREPEIDHERLWREMQRRMAEQAAAQAAAEAAAAAQFASGPAAPEVSPVLELEVEEELPDLEGEILLKHDCPVLGLKTDPTGALHFLDENGDVYRCNEDGSEKALARFSMDEPLGLAAVSGGRFAAVDQPGKLFLTGGASDTIDTACPIEDFSVNSFGSILAYTSPDSSSVRGLIVAAAKDQLFIDCEARLNGIAFSADNRFLAIGTMTGKTLIFDMANRKITQTLVPNTSGYVTGLCPTRDGWIIAYEHSRVAAWDNQGELLHTAEASSDIISLAVDPRSGNVAWGSGDGYITVLDQDFDELATAHVCENSIMDLLFEPSGSLAIADYDGTITRYRL